jgi:hypothetical protein
MDRNTVIEGLQKHLSPERTEELTRLVKDEASALVVHDTYEFSVSVLSGELALKGELLSQPEDGATLVLSDVDEDVVLAEESSSVIDSVEDAAHLLTRAFVIAMTHWALLEANDD